MTLNVVELARDPDPTPCQLNVEPFYMCCCNCVSHVKDYKHCCIHGKTAEGGCNCGTLKGYICAGFNFENRDINHSEWPEHAAGCEMYRPRAIIHPWEKHRWTGEVANAILCIVKSDYNLGRGASRHWL